MEKMYWVLHRIGSNRDGGRDESYDSGAEERRHGVEENARYTSV